MSARTVPLSYFGPLAEDWWHRFPVGAKVRWTRRLGRIDFSGTPAEGEGTVALIWNCMGELTWDIDQALKVDPQSFVPIKQNRVHICPSMGDSLVRCDAATTVIRSTTDGSPTSNSYSVPKGST